MRTLKHDLLFFCLSGLIFAYEIHDSLTFSSELFHHKAHEQSSLPNREDMLQLFLYSHVTLIFKLCFSVLT